ncbi:MAG: SRPBCC domain-containing protein [Cyclobacteriaceae bacterium]|jgi:uncharacterized protein YndB with AHSA1/START domain|nr:SRPBCC domain-containing protein [Cyclobacteriaceae bacterium]
MNNQITISSEIFANKEKVWQCYTDPNHITKWNFADPSWHCPEAFNNLQIGGKYFARMEARDGSFGFDFEAIYTKIETGKFLEYNFDNRNVSVSFKDNVSYTTVIISFDPELENPVDLQQAGWQSILNNFKNYVEAN